MDEPASLRFMPFRGLFSLSIAALWFLIFSTSQINDTLTRTFEPGSGYIEPILFVISMTTFGLGVAVCTVTVRKKLWDMKVRKWYVTWSIGIYLIMFLWFAVDELSAAEIFPAPISITLFLNTFIALAVLGENLKLKHLSAAPVLVWIAAVFYALMFPSQEVADLIASPEKDGVLRVSNFMEHENRLVLENRPSFSERNHDEGPFSVSNQSSFCTVLQMLATYETDSLNEAYESALLLAEGKSGEEGSSEINHEANSSCLEYLAHFEHENSFGRHPEVRESFRIWIGSRTDTEYYRLRSRKYPVFLVAAQGGGIYAAAHTSLFLSRIQAICPSFAHHLFAISGVSGGSVGASVFAGTLARTEPITLTEPDCPLTGVNADESVSFQETLSFANADHLSPLIGVMLTTDLLSDILPFLPETKRGNAFRRSILSSVETPTSEYLALGLAGAWSPQRDIPALLLNSTEVDQGRRLVLTPFSSRTITEPDFPFFSRHLGDQYFIDESDYKRGLTVVDAAIASARFPFVTGSLTIPTAFETASEDDFNEVAVQLVDGGYYDNSGGETLEEMVSLLETRFGDEVEFFILAFSGTYQDRAMTPLHPAWEPGREQPSHRYLTNLRHSNSPRSDIVAPFQTFVQSRRFRGQLALERLNDIVSDDCTRVFTVECVVRRNFLRFPLDDQKLELPLGWTLSSQKLLSIIEQLPSIEDCGVEILSEGFEVDEVISDIEIAQGNEILFRAFWDFRLPEDRERAANLRSESGSRNLLPEEFQEIFSSVSGPNAGSSCALISVREILLDTFFSDEVDRGPSLDAVVRTYVERWFGQTGGRINIGRQ